jgi:hypothetical protein
MKMFRKRVLALCLISAFAGSAHAADPAAEDPLHSATLKLIELLVQQGVLTRDKADALIREANRPAPKPSPAAPATAGTEGADANAVPPGTVRVPYVPQFVRDEIKEEVKKDLTAQAEREGWAAPNSVPDWVRSMKWEGDLRVRVETDSFADGNAPAINVLATNSARALTLLNTSQTVDRERVRARVGFTDELDDTVTAGMRLATGSASDPLSENQTLGAYETRYQIALDRAYVKYQPVSWFSTTAGRFENPLVGTDLVWSPDLSFDGIVLKAATKLDADTRVFVTEMASPVQEIDLGFHNKYLFSTQAGVEQQWGSSTKGSLALGYFRYSGIEGVVSPTGSAIYEYTAPEFAQKGNTYYNISSDPTRPLLGLASAYHELDLTGTLDTVAYGPYHVIFTADYVKNLGFNESAVSERVGTDVQPKTTGYLLRIAYGMPEIHVKNDWQVFATYKHLERDAVLDAFTDSDFHLGGTDAKGYVVGLSYGIAHNTWITARYFSTDSISGPPLSIDTVQFDLNAKF